MCVIKNRPKNVLFNQICNLNVITPARMLSLTYMKK